LAAACGKPADVVVAEVAAGAAAAVVAAVSGSVAAEVAAAADSVASGLVVAGAARAARLEPAAAALGERAACAKSHESAVDEVSVLPESHVSGLAKRKAATGDPWQSTSREDRQGSMTSAYRSVRSMRRSLP
jgi:hypothetical protein